MVEMRKYTYYTIVACWFATRRTIHSISLSHTHTSILSHPTIYHNNNSKFFTTQKKGEMHELRMELHSQDRVVKVDAVKKVIASMTVGKDVSMLFTDVLNCVQTGNIELKKLVYLYLINYAKSQPELTLLAVNTFVKDASDPNPLIRALAVRTMGCIRVDRITEYLCEPPGRALRDDDSLRRGLQC